MDTMTLLFACHAWITASYILLCQRPHCLNCLFLSSPPDHLWGSVADTAPSSDPFSLVCASSFSSFPAHSCLFTSLKLPTPLTPAQSFSCSLQLTISCSLLLWSRETPVLCQQPATWPTGWQFLPFVCDVTIPEPFQTSVCTRAACYFPRIEHHLPLLHFPFPPLSWSPALWPSPSSSLPPSPFSTFILILFSL